MRYANAPCKYCGRSTKKYKSGRPVCSSCQDHLTEVGYPYLMHRGDKCEQCGFVPVHPCQLSVDHIDGNRKNNALSNLQTLCHNCHALKTFVSKDWGNGMDEPDDEQGELF